MAESFSPVEPGAPLAPLAETSGARSVPWWTAALLTLGGGLLGAWGSQTWLTRDSALPQTVQGLSADDQSTIDLAPPAAGVPLGKAAVHAPTMLYGLLPLHTGHGLRDEQCRQLAAEAMKDAGITEIDAGGESALFARQGDYALFVGCHLDQKLVLVGTAGPVPEQAESLQEQLLRSLQSRF